MYIWTDHPGAQDLHYWYELSLGVSQSGAFLLGVNLRSRHRVCVYIWFLAGQELTPWASRLHYFGDCPSNVYPLVTGSQPIQHSIRNTTKSLTGSARRVLFTVESEQGRRLLQACAARQQVNSGAEYLHIFRDFPSESLPLVAVANLHSITFTLRVSP